MELQLESKRRKQMLHLGFKRSNVLNVLHYIFVLEICSFSSRVGQLYLWGALRIKTFISNSVPQIIVFFFKFNSYYIFKNTFTFEWSCNLNQRDENNVASRIQKK